MKQIELDGRTGYEAVEAEVLPLWQHTGESLVVELMIKYKHEPEYERKTELLLNDGPDWFTPRYVWESDWWEGQQDIILVGSLPVSRIRLAPENQRVHANDDYDPGSGAKLY